MRKNIKLGCGPCIIEVDAYGVYRCVNCRAFFTKKALEVSLKDRFGEYWFEEMENLISMKRNQKKLK